MSQLLGSCTNKETSNLIARPISLRNTGVQRLVSQITSVIPAGKTTGTIHQLPSNAIGIQFEFANAGADTTVYNAAFAVSAGTNDFTNPLNEGGVSDETLWVPITAGGTIAIRVPPGTITQPGRTLSDVMPFTSQPLKRIDGGGDILLFFRQADVSGNHTVGSFDGTLPAVNGAPNGLLSSQFSVSLANTWIDNGNLTIAGGYGTSNHYTGNAFKGTAPHAILPVLAGPVYSIMSVGDSILSGVSSNGPTLLDSGINGVGLQVAKALTKKNRPFLHYNLAVSGMISSDFIADATNALALIIPDVILLQTYSANDNQGNPTTNAASWTAFQRAMMFANIATLAGSKVVVLLKSTLCRNWKCTRHNVTWEADRLYANNLVRGSGAAFVDADAVVGIKTVPVSYQSHFSNDQIHPNNAGAGALASAVLSVLQTAYGIF